MAIISDHAKGNSSPEVVRLGIIRCGDFGPGLVRSAMEI